MVRPKKHLGQHFLTDRNIAEKIVRQLGEDHQTVVEVGPGTGVLTGFLLDIFSDKLQLVEVDAESVAFLHAQYPSLGNRLHHADFLKTDLTSFAENDLAVIGNFPYNIGSQIFFHVLENRHIVSEVVCMIQKEVAERIASPPGNKTYGILSVLLQAWYHIDYCFTVNEQVFQPPPKVKSAVIRLRRNDVTVLGCDERFFHQLVKKAFSMRRKTLRNCLREWLHPNIIQNEVFNKRAEQLGVNDFIELTRLISNNPVASDR